VGPRRGGMGGWACDVREARRPGTKKPKRKTRTTAWSHHFETSSGRRPGVSGAKSTKAARAGAGHSEGSLSRASRDGLREIRNGKQRMPRWVRYPLVASFLQRRVRSASRTKLHQEAGRESEKSLGEADESVTGSTFFLPLGAQACGSISSCRAAGSVSIRRMSPSFGSAATSKTPRFARNGARRRPMIFPGCHPRGSREAGEVSPGTAGAGVRLRGRRAAHSAPTGSCYSAPGQPAHAAHATDQPHPRGGSDQRLLSTR